MFIQSEQGMSYLSYHSHRYYPLGGQVFKHITTWEIKRKQFLSRAVEHQQRWPGFFCLTYISPSLSSVMSTPRCHQTCQWIWRHTTPMQGIWHLNHRKFECRNKPPLMPTSTLAESCPLGIEDVIQALPVSGRHLVMMEGDRIIRPRQRVHSVRQQIMAARQRAT